MTNNSLAEQCDEVLVRLTLEQGSQYFGNLVKRHADYIYGLGMRLTGGDHSLANDVSQQAFIKAFQYLKSFDPSHTGLGADSTKRFRNWLTGIAVNCHTDLSVAEGKYVGFEEEELCAIESNREYSSSRTNLSDFEAMIAPLTVSERQLITLRFVYEFSIDEISGILKLNSGTVKSKISRTVAKLRELSTTETMRA